MYGFFGLVGIIGFVKVFRVDQSRSEISINSTGVNVLDLRNLGTSVFFGGAQ